MWRRLTVDSEYEKTIQSLETSLTSTRSSLSNSESTLLEKESRLAYVETVNQQLQTRLQKMMDRESSTETYLHDLEMKLDGHTSGEEKNAAIINELKKEIARVRENEAGCEDYISTLEERLAEAEQDMELMQREIDRLEHVVDRQRSLGKLDNLLLELDSIKDKENGTTNGERNGDGSDTPRPASKTESVQSEHFMDGARDESLASVRSPTPHGTPPIKESPAEEDYIPEAYKPNDTDEYMPQSPSQSQFVADKLETVQQELFDLKVEHEQTLSEYGQMNANYEAALRNLAALQDQLDEMRHSKAVVTEETSRGTSPPESPTQRPTSFLADARVSDMKVSERQPSSSRSLSSELSLVGEDPSPLDIMENDRDGLRIHLETETEREASRASSATPDDLLKQVETLLKEKEEIERTAEKEQQRLQRQLNNARDELSDLKSFSSPFNSGGRNSPPSQFLRRKSSQSLAVVDRAQRAFGNLRRIATTHLADFPNVLENFELNLDGAIRELQARSDRIQELENEVAALRKDMESKTTMIAGLTRERTSIQSSPMDISVVAVMQRRIDETEAQLHKTRLSLVEREGELSSARKSLEAFSGESQSEAITLLDELTKERKLNAEQASKIAELQDEVEQIKLGQIHALNSLQESKQNLERTLRELEADLVRTKETALQHEQNIRHTFDRQVNDYQDRIDALQITIADNKQTIDSQLTRVAKLENSQTEAQRQIEAQLANESSSDEEVKKHQSIVVELERTISQNKELIESQQARLNTLEQSYDEAVKELQALKEEKAAALVALKEAEERALEEATMTAAIQDELLTAVRAELADSQEAVATHVNNLAELQASYDALQSSLQSTVDESTESKEALERQLTDHRETIAMHVATLKELQEIQDQREIELEKLREKEKKHAKLVEDLEQELTFTFDQNQESANTLASITKDYEKAKQERDDLAATSEQKAVESQKVFESLNEEIVKLRVLYCSE